MEAARGADEDSHRRERSRKRSRRSRSPEVGAARAAEARRYLELHGPVAPAGSLPLHASAGRHPPRLFGEQPAAAPCPGAVPGSGPGVHSGPVGGAPCAAPEAEERAREATRAEHKAQRRRAAERLEELAPKAGGGREGRVAEAAGRRAVARSLDDHAGAAAEHVTGARGGDLLGGGESFAAALARERAAAERARLRRGGAGAAAPSAERLAAYNASEAAKMDALRALLPGGR